MFFCEVADAYVFVSGRVTNQCNDGVYGVTVKTDGIGYSHTDSQGYYIMNDIDMERYSVSFSKSGYVSDRKTVYFNYTNNIVCNGCIHFIDSDDGDGVYYCTDNCPSVPNGPQKGTCVCGTERGKICYAQDQCGCAGFGCCDNNQTGLACAPCAKIVGGCDVESLSVGRAQLPEDFSPNQLFKKHYEWIIVNGVQERIMIDNVYKHLEKLVE